MEWGYFSTTEAEPSKGNTAQLIDKFQKSRTKHQVFGLDIVPNQLEVPFIYNYK